MLRRIAYAMLSAAIASATPVRAETHDIGDVFREFESICFAYAETGNGVELSFLIEQAGFKFVQKQKNGNDVYYSDAVQLIIGDRACALGMAQLPFGQMLEWTKMWAADRGLMDAADSQAAKDKFWAWAGMGFNIRLEDNRLPDGTALTGLILVRK